MELHSAWIRELTDQAISYKYKNVVEGAHQDCLTSDGTNAFMARLLLAFTCIDHSTFEDALRHLDEAKEEIVKVSDQDTRGGYEYLTYGLYNLMHDRKGETKEITQDLEFGKLNDRAKAVIYACKGYTLSRWEPSALDLSIVDAFAKACKLDPDNSYYMIGYAMALGRQRRKLGSSDRIDQEEILSRILAEKDIWKSCQRSGEADEKVFAKTFIAYLNSEIVLFSNASLRSKNEVFKEALNLLDGVYEELRSGTIRFNKITIAKRGAMSYKRLMSYSREDKRRCFEKAEELFSYAYNLAVKAESSENCVYYPQLSTEYGKFLMANEKYSAAKDVFMKVWTDYNLGEPLLLYVKCCRLVSMTYNPLKVIEDGLSKLTPQDAIYKVILLCLKADYLLKEGRSSIEYVKALMDALRIDPEGNHMKGVAVQLGVWVQPVRKSAYVPPAHRKRFINYVEVLENYLVNLAGNGEGDHQERLFYLRKLVEFYRVKNPPDLQKALRAIENAIEVTSSDTVKEDMTKEMDAVKALLNKVEEGSCGGLSDTLQTLSI